MRKGLVPLALVAAALACSESGGPVTAPGALVVPAFSHQGVAHNHRAHLSGAEEVPPVPTRATGQAIFRLNDDGTLSYKLIVANIRNVTMAHIHLAPRGANGPAVVWLYPSSPPPQLIPGRSQGVLAEGVITDSDLRDLLLGQTVADLLEHIRNGNAYVNVHTSAFPGGEVRGQIR